MVLRALGYVHGFDSRSDNGHCEGPGVETTNLENPCIHSDTLLLVHELGSLFVGVLTRMALLFGVHTRTPDFRKSIRIRKKESVCY